MQRLVWQSTVSAEASYSCDPVCVSPRCMQIVCEWMLRDSVRDRCELCRKDLDAVYSAQPWLFCFTRRRPSVNHAHSCRAAQSPGCIAALGAYGSLTCAHDWHLSVSAVGTHYSLGTLIPECNDLSQYRQDTGKPSTPVWEFNLIAGPLVQSCWKTPFQSRIRTLVGKSPWPIRPAGIVAYLTVV